MEYVLVIRMRGRVSDDCRFALIRPDVRFFCDLNFDPFLLMQDEGKVYGTMNISDLFYGRGSVNSGFCRFHDFVV